MWLGGVQMVEQELERIIELHSEVIQQAGSQLRCMRAWSLL